MAQQIYNLPSGFPLSGSERAPFSLVASDGHLTPEMLHHWHTSAAFVAISAASQTIAPKIRLVLWTGSGTGTATLTAIGDALNQVPLGTQIEILSRGSGALTVKGSDGSTIATVANGEHCILTARTAPATWVARKLVLDTDPRLSDAREPTAHNHDVSDVGGLSGLLGLKADRGGSNLEDPETWRAGLGIISAAETREGLNSKASIRGRRYSGGATRINADARINGMWRYGGTVLIPVLPFGIASTPQNIFDSGATGWSLTLRDPVNNLAAIDFRHSNAAGDLMFMRTGPAVPINRWSWLIIDWTGLFSSYTQARIFVNNTLIPYAPALSGTPGGTIGDDGSNKYIGNSAALTQPFDGLIGTPIFLNYALTDAERLTFLHTGKLPQDTFEIGSMQPILSDSTWSGASGPTPPSGWAKNGEGTLAFAKTSHDGETDALRIICSDDNGGIVRGFASGTAIGSGVSQRAYVQIRYKVISGTWQLRFERTPWSYDLPSTSWTTLQGVYGTGYATALIRCTSGAGEIWVKSINVHPLGNLLPGLDLGEQPILSRTTNNIVALDLSSRVALFPAHKPERMMLTTQARMTVDGFLPADLAVLPAGYAITQIYGTNTGSSSTTVTLKADSSGGTTIASGSIPTGGGAVPVAITNGAPFYNADRKIHVSGISGTGASIGLTLHLARID